MSKKYLMFIDENGFTDKMNNFYMLGVIFDEEYYMKKDIQSILNNMYLNEDVDNIKIKDLKFNVIMSKITYEDDVDENTVSNAFKKLLYRYYCFLVENGGENAGIAFEWKKEMRRSERGQIIFNLYMDKDGISEMDECNTLINRFMIIDNTFTQYTNLLKMYTLIKNPLIYSCNKQENNTKKYVYNDIINQKIIETIKRKFFIEEIAFDI